MTAFLQLLYLLTPSPVISYASAIRTIFFDSFLECDRASCIMENFCTNSVKHTDGNDSIYNLLKQRCMNDSWRFQMLIKDGTTDACEFSIVPMNGVEVESCGL